MRKSIEPGLSYLQSHLSQRQLLSGFVISNVCRNLQNLCDLSILSDQLESVASRPCFFLLLILLEADHSRVHDDLRDSDDQPAAVPRDAAPSR